MKISNQVTAILLGCCTLLLAGCGPSHQARQKVEDFMKDQMSLTGYDVVEWSEVKPTYFVSDSVLQVMRHAAVSEKQVRSGTQYAKPTSPLQMLRVKYAIDKDTLTKTFYLDDQMTAVVGFKNN